MNKELRVGGLLPQAAGPQSPWDADAAEGATMREYEIRTIVDFLKVPESRRCICLREFHSWLHMQTAVLDLLMAAGVKPGQVQLRDPGVFTWKDDGAATVSIVLHDKS